MEAIAEHTASAMYRDAVDADNYDRQRNTAIIKYQKFIHSITSAPVEDTISANHKIPSNFFRRFCVQRNQYSLGNGVSFDKDGVKDKLGNDFDTELQKAGYAAIIHGLSFGFWNYDHLVVFKLTEFAPLWDEDTGLLMAGIRFWQVDHDRPKKVVLYEIDGYTQYKVVDGEIAQVEEKRAYKQIIRSTPALGEEVVGGENYPSFPIVPMWGSDLKQSALVGIKSAIDCYDLIRSGFANDLTDCALIYWIIDNAGGMEDIDKARFIQQLRTKHLATVDADSGVKITPYTQDIPYESRTAYLDRLREGLYEDFGALDVKAISAAAKTATEINAAYQPLDENADAYEYQLIDFVRGILALQGIDDVPIFKRSRIANVTEETQTILLAAAYLDDETIIEKLPFITLDEVDDILARRDDEETSRVKALEAQIEAMKAKDDGQQEPDEDEPEKE